MPGDNSMNMQAAFNTAQTAAKNLSERPGNGTLLEIYALYKQATEGDVDGDRPGFNDMVGRAKFDAWATNKGLSKADAMQKYVDLIRDLQT